MAAALSSAAVLALLGTQPSPAQSENVTYRPPSFTYPAIQSKLRSGDAIATGSMGKNGPRSISASSAGRTGGRTDRIGGGRATFYQHAGRTASGERYDPNGLTAAHHSLPFGSKVRVVNKRNGRSVVVRITDRTNTKTEAKRPYVIDLSRGSARVIGIRSVGMVTLYRTD